jgi:hypothetical protein
MRRAASFANFLYEPPRVPALAAICSHRRRPADATRGLEHPFFRAIIAPLTGASRSRRNPLRKPADIDRLLENAVATALGLDRPHPSLPGLIRPPRRRALSRRGTNFGRRRHGVSLPWRERRKAA